LKVVLVTGGAPHYELGLVQGLAAVGVSMEVICGEEIEDDLKTIPGPISVLNFRGRNLSRAGKATKVLLVARYYVRLLWHALSTDAKIFHIQWPYKLQFFDRTILPFYLRALGKKVIFTAHNIDQAARDGKRSLRNRFSLFALYRGVNHIIVHTEKMREQLTAQFGVHPGRISVLPHGVMSSVRETSLTREEARKTLGLGVSENDKVLLFFGLIAPYKGLEYLILSAAHLKRKGHVFRVLIAGRIKECKEYWSKIEGLLDEHSLRDDFILHLRHIPDSEVETFFKAADVAIMPYTEIFQSGVLFLAYRFGLPVIASDVGELRKDIIEGKTGFLAKTKDAVHLAHTIEHYFASDLFLQLPARRIEIKDYAFEKYSWESISRLTRELYSKVLAAALGGSLRA
jgi:D-inositol-3-phosphate glycosyltransferase